MLYRWLLLTEGAIKIECLSGKIDDRIEMILRESMEMGCRVLIEDQCRQKRRYVRSYRVAEVAVILDKLMGFGGIESRRSDRIGLKDAMDKVLKVLSDNKGSWIGKGSVAWAHNQRDYRNVD